MDFRCLRQRLAVEVEDGGKKSAGLMGCAVS